MWLRLIPSRFCFFALVVTPLVVPAQTLQTRLTGNLEGSPRAVLAHSRSPRVEAAEDLGAVPAELPIHGITLVFRRTPNQEAELQQLLAAQQNRSSPTYHQWLSQATFAARFGVADADLQTATNWLSTQGFRVDGIAGSRDRITFSGTAAQVQNAFGTALHRYRVEGAPHFAPARDLTLPAPLAAITAAVLHLSDFRPAPMWRVSTHPKPEYTEAGTGVHYLVPADLAVMYDFVPAYQPSSAQAISHVTPVAVVGQSYVDLYGLRAYQILLGGTGSSNEIVPIMVPGSGVESLSYGDEGESELDLEYINTTGASVNPFFVFVGDSSNYSVLDALAYVITENLAPVASISYGICEPLLSTTELDQWNALFEQAAAQGQTIVASSGDSGSTGCLDESTATGITATQQQAPAVVFPASNPYVTAVGGTQMASGTFNPGNVQYWSPNSSGLESLLSYVPEQAWNEGSQKAIVAGGGGSSSYYPRPAWQTNFPGTPAGPYRLVPDISLQSSIASPGFAFCTSDPSVLAAEGQTASCNNELLGSNNQATVAGGTSFAAPIFAGMVSLINSIEKAQGQGNLNQNLYTLAANNATYASAFHDIIAGTISCVPGAANCTSASQGDFAAQPGYDEATGLGSIDFDHLLTSWPVAGTSALLPTFVAITASQDSVNAGDSVALQIAVGLWGGVEGSPVPTGTVSVAIDNVVVNPSVSLSPGSSAIYTSNAIFNVSAPSTPGYHLVTVSYPGDLQHASANASYPVLVGSVNASGNFALAVSNLTLSNNTQGVTQVTVTPGGGYSGVVVWSLSILSGSTTSLSGCYGVEPLRVNNASTVNLTIGVGTACQTQSPSYRGRFRSGPGTRADAVPLSKKPAAPWNGAYAGILLCGALAARRRKWGSVLTIILGLSCCIFVPLGCGGSGSGGSAQNVSTPGKTTSPQTYTMRLDGRDSVSPIAASATFTLTVN
jgi:hypothetical protein